MKQRELPLPLRPDAANAARASAIAPDTSAPDAPAFDEPWQAKAFAVAVYLNEAGVFGWGEWAAAFGERLAARAPQAPTEPDAVTADYYAAWIETLEALLVRHGLADAAQIAMTTEAWQAAARATPHGQPITLDAAR